MARWCPSSVSKATRRISFSALPRNCSQAARSISWFCPCTLTCRRGEKQERKKSITKSSSQSRPIAMRKPPDEPFAVEGVKVARHLWTSFSSSWQFPPSRTESKLKTCHWQRAEYTQTIIVITFVSPGPEVSLAMASKQQKQKCAIADVHERVWAKAWADHLTFRLRISNDPLRMVGRCTL